MKFISTVAFLFLSIQGVYADSFEEQMCEREDQLTYVQTDEDRKRIGLFSAMFDLTQKAHAPKEEIPKVLHLIWLGPRPFPQEGIAAVAGWVEQHPSWKLKFWTDMERPLPHPKAEIHLIEDFPLGDLKNYYYQCDNFGERSILLRYAILLEEGGVCIEHDTTCLKSLEHLRGRYDFFCGMESLGPTILSSSVNPSPHLIGVAPHHPILRSAKIWLKKEWERLERDYPGNDPDAVYHRVQRRSFRALGIGIKQEHNRNGRRDVVFPPRFFNLNDPSSAEYATHAHQGTWHQNLSEAEIKIQKLLSKAADEAKGSFLLVLALTAVNVFAGGFFLFQAMSSKRRFS